MSENKVTTPLVQDQFRWNGGVKLTVRRIDRQQENSTFYIVNVVLIINSFFLYRSEQWINISIVCST